MVPERSGCSRLFVVNVNIFDRRFDFDFGKMDDGFVPDALDSKVSVPQIVSEIHVEFKNDGDLLRGQEAVARGFCCTALGRHDLFQRGLHDEQWPRF